MPHASLKLQGGVVVNETPALNQAGIASCNLIRFKPDPQGLSLPEKIGGWARFWANQVTNGVVRALWGYQDTEAEKWIVYGTSNPAGAQLAAIQCFTNLTTGLTTASAVSNFFHDITPEYFSDSVPIIATTISGSPIVTITDPTVSGVSSYDAVYFTTPVAVGGLVLSGLYATGALSGDQYEIEATNVLGNLEGAAYTTMSAAQTVTGVSFSSGPPKTLTFTFTGGYTGFAVGESLVVNGCVPTTANGTYIIHAKGSGTVAVVTTLSSYSYSSGGTITNYGTVPIFETTSGSSVVQVGLPNHQFAVGDTFYVLNQTVVNGMTLYGDYPVLSVIDPANFTINGPSNATSTGYQLQNAITVLGGTGNGTSVTLTIGNATYASPTITITGGSSTSSHVTLTWTSPSYTFVIGNTILVSGANPVTWNGTYAVTGSTSTSVTYALSGSVLSWVSGGLVINAPFNLSAPVLVSGVNPTAWNGWFILTGVTANTITYANTTSGSWVNGGSVSDNGGDEGFIYSIGMGPPALGTGFGVGGFGVGGFGSGSVTNPIMGANVGATTWDLNNWGDITLALPIGTFPITYAGVGIPFQPIYYWNPTANQPIAQAIVAGPPVSNGMFVAMPQRQIIAWGSSFSGVIDPLLIRWCDVNNYNTWVAQVTNQAGSFRLSSGSIIMGGLQTPQQGLIWTDIELWSMQYIGQPYVYSFNKIGQGCGLIARRACCAMNGIIFWMSNEQFFTLSSNGVQPLVCPIWDTVYQQLDLANVSKITCQANSLFQEVTWSYPVQGGTGDVSAYVQYNSILNVWSFGFNATNTIARSAWMDVSVLGQPIGFDPVASYIYQHEISPDADGVAMTPTFTTGWFAISEGDVKTYTDEVWPDFKYEYFNGIVSANVQLTFSVTDFPWQAPYTYGPYTVTNQTTWINPRFRGRLCSITVSSGDLGTWWRLGNLRYRVAPDGRY